MTDQKPLATDGTRITLRLTPAQKDLLRRAADVAGMPVSAFVLQTAAQAAEQLLGDPSPAALVKGVEHLRKAAPTAAKATVGKSLHDKDLLDELRLGRFCPSPTVCGRGTRF